MSKKITLKGQFMENLSQNNIVTTEKKDELNQNMKDLSYIQEQINNNKVFLESFENELLALEAKEKKFLEAGLNINLKDLKKEKIKQIDELKDLNLTLLNRKETLEKALNRLKNIKKVTIEKSQEKIQKNNEQVSENNQEIEELQRRIAELQAKNITLKEEVEDENLKIKDYKAWVKKNNNTDNLEEEEAGEFINNDKEESVEVDNTDKEESVEVNNESQEKNEDKGEPIEVNQDTIDKITSGNNGITSRRVNKEIDIEQESKKYENTPLRGKFSSKGKKALLDFTGKNLKNLNQGSFKNSEENKDLSGELEVFDIDKYLSEANSIKIEIEKIKDLLTDKEIEVENSFKRGLTVEEFEKDILIIEDEIDNIKNKIESFKKELSEKGFLENENFSEIREFLEENDLENIFENFMNKIFKKYESGKLESKEDKIYEKLVEYFQAFELFDKNNLTSENKEYILRCEKAIKYLKSNEILDENHKDIISKLENKIASFEINKSGEKTKEIEENNLSEKTELSDVEKQALTEIQGVDEFYNNEENSKKFGNRIFDFITSMLGGNKNPYFVEVSNKSYGYKKLFDNDITELSKVNNLYDYIDENFNTIDTIKDILQKNLENFKKFFGIEEKMKNFSRIYEQNNLSKSFEVIRNSKKSLKELSENQIFTLNEEELIKFEERFNQILAEYEEALKNIKNSLENLDDIEKQEVILSCEKEIAYIKKEISENKEKYKTSLINKDLNNQTESQSSNDKGISEIDFPKPTITRLATPVSLPVAENISETKETSEYEEKFLKNLFNIPEVGNSFNLQGNEYLPGVKEGKGWTGGTMYTFSEFKNGKPNGLTVIYTTTGIKKMEGIYENGKMESGLHFDEKGKVTKKTVDGKTTKV